MRLWFTRHLVRPTSSDYSCVLFFIFLSSLSPKAKYNNNKKFSDYECCVLFAGWLRKWYVVKQQKTSRMTTKQICGHSVSISNCLAIWCLKQIDFHSFHTPPLTRSSEADDEFNSSSIFHFRWLPSVLHTTKPDAWLLSIYGISTKQQHYPNKRFQYTHAFDLIVPRVV